MLHKLGKALVGEPGIDREVRLVVLAIFLVYVAVAITAVIADTVVAFKQAVVGGVPCRYNPNCARAPAGSGCLSPRPRTSRPDGRQSTPGADCSHTSMSGNVEECEGSATRRCDRPLIDPSLDVGLVIAVIAVVAVVAVGMEAEGIAQPGSAGVGEQHGAALGAVA